MRRYVTWNDLPLELIPMIAQHLDPLSRQCLAMATTAYRDLFYVDGGVNIWAVRFQHAPLWCFHGHYHYRAPRDNFNAIPDKYRREHMFLFFRALTQTSAWFRETWTLEEKRMDKKHKYISPRFVFTLPVTPTPVDTRPGWRKPVVDLRPALPRTYTLTLAHGWQVTVGEMTLKAATFDGLHV